MAPENIKVTDVDHRGLMRPVTCERKVQGNHGAELEGAKKEKARKWDYKGSR